MHQLLLSAAKQENVALELVCDIEALKSLAEIDYLRAEIPKAIEEALQGVARVASIVQAMKAFSHPGSDEKTPVDLNKAIENTIVVSRNEWKYVAEMDTDLQPGIPLVPCFRGDFSQVILNLIVNAVHAIETKIAQEKTGRNETV